MDNRGTNLGKRPYTSSATGSRQFAEDTQPLAKKQSTLAKPTLQSASLPSTDPKTAKVVQQRDDVQTYLQRYIEEGAKIITTLNIEHQQKDQQITMLSIQLTTANQQKKQLQAENDSLKAASKISKAEVKKLKKTEQAFRTLQKAFQDAQGSV
ncbi:hypothetical protein LTR08_006419 [Meristemomyces frigidus]|nr:hypothetical protein LTR08_006419 [Meristemomyces frigidus]